MAEVKEIVQALIEGEADRVRELTEACVNQGMEPSKILNDGLIAGMAEVGERFKREEIYLPEVLFSARAMKVGMEVLQPVLASSGVKPIGKMVLGTVKGDVHDIGKNLVTVMLHGAGIDVIDLGVDVSPEGFVEAVKEHGVRLIGMSSLLGTSMPFMKTTIEALEAAGLKGQVKTIIGGAIVTQDYADKIGADGYARDAGSAVGKVKELLGLG